MLYMLWCIFKPIFMTLSVYILLVTPLQRYFLCKLQEKSKALSSSSVEIASLSEDVHHNEHDTRVSQNELASS